MATWGTGWIIFDVGGDNETKLRVEKWEYDDDDKGAIATPFPGRGYFGFTVNTHGRKFKFTKLFITNYADWNTLKQRLTTLEDTGTVINIKIQVDIAGNFEKPDGTNATIPLIIKKKRGYSKPYGGESQFYVIKQLLCEQGGALAA